MLLAALLAFQSPAQQPAARAVACLSAAWNAHDARAARRCYGPTAVAVRGDGTSPIDWSANDGFRGFDGVTGAVFRFDILATSRDTVDVEVHETNAFLRALGTPRVTARWRYVVRGGVIVEEHHLVRDSLFAATFPRFVDWARKARPAQWKAVSDSDGYARFDRTSARRLMGLAKEWRRQ